jgi:divalent metal cation (Fe/Co/Zn/Cd) transporter
VGAVHLVLGLALGLGQLVLGLLGRSKALVLAAIYALQHSISAAALLAGDGCATGPDEAQGRGKLTFVLTGGTSLLVFVAVAALCSAVAHSLLEHRQRPPTALALWATVGSVAICWLMRRSAACLARNRPGPATRAHLHNLRLHLVALLVVAAATLVARNGALVMDTLVAALEAVCVVWAAGRSLRQAVRGLMDASVEPGVVHQIAAAASRVEPVLAVESVRATRAGQRVAVSLVVGLPGGMSMAAASRLRPRIRAAIAETGVETGEVLVAFSAPEAWRP